MSRVPCVSCGREISGYPCVFCQRRSAFDAAKTSDATLFRVIFPIVTMLAITGAGYIVARRFTERSAQPPVDAWVAVDRLNRRTCPQVSCGSVGVLFLGDGVSIHEERNGWVRITEPYNASCFEGISEYVDSGDNLCEPDNGIINGQLAEWVSVQYLSSERPPDPAAGASGVYALIAESDDYALYKEAFAAATRRLIAERTCSEADFEEMGGWLKSMAHENLPVYFTYCGGLTLANRLYLNAATGDVFR